MNKLIIALNKGRIFKECLPILEAAGISPDIEAINNRKLFVPSKKEHVHFVVARSSDVPKFVAHCAADIGITGKDTLIESDVSHYYELVNLNIAPCKLCVAALPNADLSAPRIRVATKFAKATRNYFTARGQQVDLIKLNGAVELAPLMGMADCIVDLVDTGKTLRANGLEVISLVSDITSRLIVNKTSLKTKQADIMQIIHAITPTIEENASVK